jgi:hypothetical protein
MPRTACLLLLVLLLLPTLPAAAGGVEIVFAELRRDGDTWQPTVTLRHADTGWEHYADAWRVTTVDGEVLSHRTLYHPHVTEQPFTRSGPGFALPPGTARVVVEARDTVHGWSDDRLVIDVALPTGPRWQLFDDR